MNARLDQLIGDYPGKLEVMGFLAILHPVPPEKENRCRVTSVPFRPNPCMARLDLQNIFQKGFGH